MIRLPDWEERLNAFLERHHGAEFEWGSTDCGHFAAGAVEALTGEQINYRYKTEGQSKRILARHGRSLEAAVDKKLDWHRAPAFARRGDIVLTDDGNLAVCFGKFAYAVGEDAEGNPGMNRMLMHTWVKAWAVG